MADTLKSKYERPTVERIASMIAKAHPGFKRKAFVESALDGFDQLELMDRGRAIARAMRKHLPQDIPQALDILLRSLGPALSDERSFGMGSFAYLPHSFFVAEHGLAHFDIAMDFQRELTRRFTSEFCVRAFIGADPERAMARMALWAKDPDEHVRRLATEGCRPRLPWAGRLPAFQKDPSPVLAILESLRDDESLYVRKSVANNLNDIGKDHPEILLATAKSWARGAPAGRMWIIRRALRTLVKQGDPMALAILGFESGSALAVASHSISPAKARVGGSTRISATLSNPTGHALRAIVDLRVHFAKSNGSSGAKVFKLKVVDIEPGASLEVGKTLSLAPMSTRTLHPGWHAVDLLVNGQKHPIGGFQLASAKA